MFSLKQNKKRRLNRKVVCKKRKREENIQKIVKKQRKDEYCFLHGEKYICDIYDCDGVKENVCHKPMPYTN